VLGGGVLPLEVGGRTADITAAKLDIRRIEKAGLKVANGENLTVALDTDITEELALEGFARDLVRGGQQLRKDSGLEVSDRVRLCVSGSARLRKAWEAHADYIRAELLAVSAEWCDSALPDANAVRIDAGDEAWTISISISN
jgi:isoleucyl-tRNA synthetase